MAKRTVKRRPEMQTAREVPQQLEQVQYGRQGMMTAGRGDGKSGLETAMARNAMQRQQPGMQAGSPMMMPRAPAMMQQGMAPMAGPGMLGGGDPRMRLMQMMAARRGQGGLMQPGMAGGAGRSPQPIMGSAQGKDDPVRYGRQVPVDAARVKEATRTMMRYKSAKTATDDRIIHAQEWWRQRNWQEITGERGIIGTQRHKSSTGWLKTAIVGKHADYMEAYPEPLFLARNQEDEVEAQHLSEIVPVVLSMIDFSETYSDVGWQKITEGTGVYGVTWDGQAAHGMGEISITKINALNLYVEPGVEDVQESSNVFLVRKEDNQRLEAMYPQLVGKLGRTEMEPAKYRPVDQVDEGDKSLVVDWYYRKHVGGREVLHYCKYVGDVVLYASENDPQMAQGYYHHGMYPFVLDPYLPDAGTVWGQGAVDMAKGTQMDIDTMSQAMVTNAAANATPRYFNRGDSGINEDEFLDWSRPIVHTNGNLGADSIVRVEVPTMDGNTLNFYQSKVEELKFVLGNTEVMNGDVPSGVTSGVAIAALKEDAGRSSKDMNRATYRAMKQLYIMVVELIRQFYTMDRQFRVVGEDGMARYVQYSNARLVMQTEMAPYGVSHRMPQFDVDVHVQRENAYTRMALNDLATQFYGMGLFNPMAAPQALTMLQMMEFTGKDKLVRIIQQNFMQTMAMMGGMAPSAAPAQAPQQGGKQGEMRSTPTEEDATESGMQRNAQAHTPGTDRMRQRVNEAVRP